MAQGGGARLAGGRETTKADPVSAPRDRLADERRSGVSIAESIQTVQAFLGYFNPAEAKRMAQESGAQLAGEGETTKADPVSAPGDQATDERLLRRLSALQDALPDLDVAIEDTIAEGDRVAVRFAVTSHQAGVDLATAPGILICRVAGGKIVEHWMQPDVPALLQMLGTTPTPART
jgi:predicted ester cyclase